MNENHKPYSKELHSRDLGMKTSLRQKQQKEWDRLVIPLSVTTATSAAALAIPSPFGAANIHWLATAFYSTAFGLSLSGIIMLMGMTVFGSGTCCETVGRIATGKGFLKGMTGPVAFAIALPAAITTYSLLFLFAGVIAMTFGAKRGSNMEEHLDAFQAIVLLPICVISTSIVLVVAGWEFFVWQEAVERQKRKEEIAEEAKAHAEPGS